MPESSPSNFPQQKTEREFTAQEMETALPEMIYYLRKLYEEFENPQTSQQRKGELTLEIREIMEHFKTIKRVVLP